MPSLLVLGAYLVGAWVLFQPLGLLDGSHIPAEVASRCGCSDDGQQVWLLAAAHARLVAGHLPFFTRSVNFPTGVNLMDTAGFPLLATVAAPITGIIGPVETLNLLLRVSLVTSATACYFVLRRLRLRTAAAALGGALYGYSPFLVRETEAHLFIAFAPLPPIILLIAYRRLRGEIGRPFRGGLEIGALAAVQALISIEVLAIITVLVASVLVLVGAGRAARRQSIRDPVRIVTRLAGGAVVVAGPLLAYPIWYLVAGPQHIHGAPSPTGAFALSPLATVRPDGGTIVAGLWSGGRGTGHGFTSTMGFIGIPLLIVLAWVLMRLRRYEVVVPTALVGVVAWILTLGPRVRIGRGSSAHLIPLPFAVLVHLPLVQSIVPNRLALFVDLAMAVLVAVGADHLLAATERRLRNRVLGGALVLASVALILPAATVPVAGVADAQVFTSAPGRRLVPAGALVIAFPYPRYSEAQAMLWQAESGMRFDLIGGYAERPLTALDVRALSGLGAGHSRVGEGTKAPAVLEPQAIYRFFLPSRPTPDGSMARAEADLPAFVERYHVSAAMVDAAAPGAGSVISALRRVYGRPTRIGSILVWSPLEPAS